MHNEKYAKEAMSQIEKRNEIDIKNKNIPISLPLYSKLNKLRILEPDEIIDYQ